MDSLRSILRAAAIAAFSVGLLLLLLNPPSLSGAGGLVTLIAGVVAFTLLVGWATVALMGSDGPSEEDFERLIRRSEELAASPQLALEADEFDLLVSEAIDRLPPEFLELLKDTPVVVSQHRIVLYQDTLERDFGWDPELLRAQVERTLRHELAHHIGWNEPGVRGLGL
jgi:predicted Zn-dependent protease with MMP-like domain